MKMKIIKIGKLAFDPEIYPRMEVQWLTAYQYAQAMRVGDEFPPITVGSFEGKLYVIDGWHRIEAKKLLKQEHIQAVIKSYKDKKEMFLDAIKSNIQHGRQLSTHEKVRLVHKLQEMAFELNQISQIVKIPLDKIELFQARVIIGSNGKPIYLKSSVVRTQADVKDMLSVDQTSLSTRTSLQLLQQLVELIRSNVLSFSDEKAKALGVELLGLLREKLELAVEAG